MPKLTRKEREDIMLLISDEEKLLMSKAEETAGVEWAAAEERLADRLGMGDNLARAVHLRDQIQALQQELAEMERSHPWRTLPPSDADFLVAGIKPPYRNHLGQMADWNVPKIFGRPLDSKWNIEVFKIINERMNILEVQRILTQTGQSIRREITLAGTFEEVRQSYHRFYELLVRAGGKEVPPLLSQIVEMPPLLPSAGAEPLT